MAQLTSGINGTAVPDTESYRAQKEGPGVKIIFGGGCWIQCVTSKTAARQFAEEILKAAGEQVT